MWGVLVITFLIVLIFVIASFLDIHYDPDSDPKWSVWNYENFFDHNEETKKDGGIDF